jgi:hypothetical protein
MQTREEKYKDNPILKEDLNLVGKSYQIAHQIELVVGLENA